LLDFYSQPDAGYSTKKKPKAWVKLQAQMQQLKAASVMDSGAAAQSSGPVIF